MDETLLEKYLTAIHPYFDIVRDKTVLEIGPLSGHHSKIIIDQGSKSLVMVEPNTSFNDSLAALSPNSEIINDDIFFYLEEARKFDVVVCCGVLYHLHSPLYLLELIANRVDPEYVIIETITGDSVAANMPLDKTHLRFEGILNAAGNRCVRENWKAIDLAHIINQSAIDYSMNKLGYELIASKNFYGTETHYSKKTAMLTIWRRT
jgi:2-polyprenyl-3-methyl-5-hydroxy-6-metoxy-1,4-benzoquinol methylase